MTRMIKARFSHGVFEPLEPAVGDLVKEGKEVTIMIETASTTPAGGWRGLIDAEALKAAIARQRSFIPWRGTVTP